ncbi:MAG: Na(+)/H(+) antiporter subunit D [Gemmatimonadetes bacterium]|nr:Na(+)/H(+) antiporter subunit D [Gemmatimonadota bacterium]|tara:strand:- start:92365 stop:94068 length:1704 start_codon:yes stop_codon:yes gene_type:complete
MISSYPPAAIFFAGAVLVAITRGRLRSSLMLLIPILGALNLRSLDPDASLTLSFMGYDLVPFKVTGLSMLFGYLFHLASFLGNLFALHLEDREHAGLQHTSALIYAGSAIGAVYAGDLISLFVFWEILALSSAFLIFARGTESSFNAGFRYLVIHVLSGVLLLSGALLRAHNTGSIGFDHIGLDGSAAGIIILVAFGIKAAFPFFHSWLTDAYPEGTPTGTVFLSSFTTKVAIFALVRSFAGTEALIYVGVLMTFFPIFFAVIENDLRRVLSYSMINQMGFMVTGVGIGTALALNGAVAHAFADVIFKGLLFMTMGSVLQMTGRINGSDLGGLYKTMPITTGLCIVGAMAISAFPLFSAFITKSMVMAAALEQGYNWVWPFLVFASAGVLEHAGIKIPYFAFFGHDSGIRVKEPPKNMLMAMGIAATLCVVIGTFPDFLYSILPFEADYHPYDLTHVVTQLQLLFFGALAVVWMMKSGIYPPEIRAINIDVEWFYRWLGPRVIGSIGSRVGSIDRKIRTSVLNVVNSSMSLAERGHGPKGPMARAVPAGSMVMWVVILLTVYLVLFL